jgi:hypothetical protein
VCVYLGSTKSLELYQVASSRTKWYDFQSSNPFLGVLGRSWMLWLSRSYVWKKNVSLDVHDPENTIGICKKILGNKKLPFQWHHLRVIPLLVLDKIAIWKFIFSTTHSEAWMLLFLYCILPINEICLNNL